MKTFHLQRNEDESGVSGTGKVAEGVQFEDGQCALWWFGDWHSIGIYRNIDELDAIHGHGGKTIIVWH